MEVWEQDGTEVRSLLLSLQEMLVLNGGAKMKAGKKEENEAMLQLAFLLQIVVLYGEERVMVIAIEFGMIFY